MFMAKGDNLAFGGSQKGKLAIKLEDKMKEIAFSVKKIWLFKGDKDLSVLEEPKLDI